MAVVQFSTTDVILAFHSLVWHLIFVTLIFFFSERVLYPVMFLKPLNLKDDNLLKQLSKQIMQVFAKSRQESKTFLEWPWV